VNSGAPEGYAVQERESAFIIIRKVNKFESKKHNISFWSEDLLMIIEVNRPGVAHKLC
jgi:hypothetical protein